MTAQGVQIVGATVGDVFPAQIGPAEGSYYAFAGVLGLGQTRRAPSRFASCC